MAWLFKVFAIAIILTGLNIFVFHERATNWAANYSGRTIASIKTLLAPFDPLRTDADELSVQIAKIEALEEEIATLKSVARANIPTQFEIIIGGIITSTQAGVNEVVINRGANDGVQNGDVVLTPHGGLIGIINEVNAKSSRARVITTKDIEIAASVVGTNISGLIRGNGTRLSLDFVQNQEPIIIGQLIRTSGKDQFPPGILIGAVVDVSDQPTALFKAIIIEPSFSSLRFENILIIHSR